VRSDDHLPDGFRVAVTLAAKRLHDIRAGAVKPVAGDEVFDEIWRRLN
jgi:hypothetical protein